MAFNFKRLLHTELGRAFISIILGLGLASLFRKVCKDKDCLDFNGPVITEVDGKIFRHGDACYKYTPQTAECDATKRTVETAEAKPLDADLKNIFGY
jgi:hypothetical protein